MVSTHLKNISQIGSFPQGGVNIKNLSNHRLDLHGLIPQKWVAFNDPRLYSRNAKIRHWAALPHALMQLLTPWFSAQSQQPDAKAITRGMEVKSREKMLKRW